MLAGLVLVIGLPLAVDLGSKRWASSALTDASFAQQESSVRVCGHPEDNPARIELVESHVTPIVVVDQWIVLRYEENCAGAFNVLNALPEAARHVVHGAVSLSPLPALVWLYRRKRPRERLALFALAFVCGGTLGNLCSWFTTRYVVDFLRLGFPIGERQFWWPTFNIADATVVLGAALFAVHVLRSLRSRAGGRAVP